MLSNIINQKTIKDLFLNIISILYAIICFGIWMNLCVVFIIFSPIVLLCIYIKNNLLYDLITLAIGIPFIISIIAPLYLLYIGSYLNAGIAFVIFILLFICFGWFVNRR